MPKMMLPLIRILTVVAALAALQQSACAKGPAYADPAKTDADFAFQGEYVGEAGQGGESMKIGVQVIALGDGQFDAVAYPGGLPGAGWSGEDKKMADGERKGDTVVLHSDHGTAEIKGDTMTVTNPDGQTVATLKKVHRESSTLGKKPPEGAVVLFDGTSAEQFQGGKMTDDGLLMQGVTSKQKFGDHKLHIEFRLPYQPEDRGQARGNSGLYLQGRYEVQMLDSFGLQGKDNECGGIYTISAPSVNMCYPPLSWQTYDVDYTAAVYEDGKKVKNARVTVRHNGQVIHDNVELPNATRAAPLAEGPEDGPVYLQDHGNPVRYRNIWVVEKK